VYNNVINYWQISCKFCNLWLAFTASGFHPHGLAGRCNAHFQDKVLGGDLVPQVKDGQ